MQYFRNHVVYREHKRLVFEVGQKIRIVKGRLKDVELLSFEQMDTIFLIDVQAIVIMSASLHDLSGQRTLSLELFPASKPFVMGIVQWLYTFGKTIFL